MKILMIGGTGLLGSQAAAELIKEVIKLFPSLYQEFLSEPNFQKKWNSMKETTWK